MYERGISVFINSTLLGEFLLENTTYIRGTLKAIFQERLCVFMDIIVHYYL